MDKVVELVIVFTSVVVVTSVVMGMQEYVCLGLRTAPPPSPPPSFSTCKPAVLAFTAGLVVLGGIYESVQSVSSSSVALTLFVTVNGKHVKSSASSDSEACVIVTVLVTTTIDSDDAVAVSVAISGQAEQYPSSPQYAMSVQH
jgi:hypothetical protein